MKTYVKVTFEVLFIHSSSTCFPIIYMVWVCWWKNIIRWRSAPPVWKANECYRMRSLHSEQSRPRLTSTFRELPVSSPPPGCQAACEWKQVRLNCTTYTNSYLHAGTETVMQPVLLSFIESSLKVPLLWTVCLCLSPPSPLPPNS